MRGSIILKGIMAKETEKILVVVTNRKARHDYHIEGTYEAGLVLQGTEVKSLRDSKANLVDSYAGLRQGEAFLYNLHISPYSHGNIENHEPRRTRKLLLHKEEIRKLVGKLKEKGYTLVPLRIYFSGNRAKVELGLGKGKKLFDKRKALAEKTAQRDVERAVRERQKI